MPNNVTILTMSNINGDIAMRRLEIQDAEVMRIAIRQEIERTDELSIKGSVYLKHKANFTGSS